MALASRQGQLGCCNLSCCLPLLAYCRHAPPSGTTPPPPPPPPLPPPPVDLCHGPHVPNTGLLKAVGVNSMSRAFWRADVNREPLQVLLEGAALECSSRLMRQA